MSRKSNKRIRMRTLVAATAIALTTMAATASAGQRVNLSSLNGLQEAGATQSRFIVKYRDGSTQATSVSALAGSLQSAARAVPSTQGVSHLRRLSVGADVIKTDRPLDRVEAEVFMRQIAADPNVEYVEADILMVAYDAPNDPEYGDQYGLKNGPGGSHAEQAWDKSTGEGVVVAVLDTGYTDHSDLLPNILPGYDFVSEPLIGNDGDGRDADARDAGDGYETGFCTQFTGKPSPARNSGWHGTHVAGTVAAVTDNAKGVAGVAPNAKVVPVRVLGRCGGYGSDITDAITWASGGSVAGVPANQNPAEVLNLSLGSQGPATCSDTTKLAMKEAVERGAIVVVAAGNSNDDASQYTQTNCGNVISVGSNTNTGARSYFSNYGASVDIAAPGSDIESTGNTGTQDPGQEDYVSKSGTSMASPHVAGVIALVQAAAETPLTQAEMLELLQDTASDFPSTPSQPIGAGIVNAEAAVNAVLAGTDPDPDPDPTDPDPTDPTPDPVDGELQNGVPVTGVAGAARSQQYWTVDVPAGATNLSIKLVGGSGFFSSADLYVRLGSQPTTTVYACGLTGYRAPKTCRGTYPTPGTYHIMVRGGGFLPYSGASLVATYDN
ncbi:S8 family peptidase [Lysobacter sp. A378]